MTGLSPLTLTGRQVRLAPLSPTHAPDLARAAAGVQGLWYTMVPTPEGMSADIDARLALREKGSMLPFAILTPDGRAVGMTTYLHIDMSVPRVEIGATWLDADLQRSGINIEAKRLLLAHAFDTLACEVVEFRTHRLNLQSRRAIEALGAQFDGIIRAHMRMSDGHIRDTAVYSIIRSEWPVVRQHLDWRLSKPRG